MTLTAPTKTLIVAIYMSLVRRVACCGTRPAQERDTSHPQECDADHLTVIQAVDIVRFHGLGYYKDDLRVLSDDEILR